MGEVVTYAAGTRESSGYVATPDGGGPGLVILPEWWGMNPHVKDLCDRFAAEGFVAISPDLYDGVVATSVEQAQELMMALDSDRVGEQMVGAADHVRGAASPAKVGAVGYCMGGGLAIALAATGRIDAGVAYYGLPSDPTFDTASVTIPMLGHFAERDDYYKVNVASDVFDGIRSNGVEAEFNTYEADHAFFNDTRPEVYNKESADLSWSRTLSFLRTKLG